MTSDILRLTHHASSSSSLLFLLIRFPIHCAVMGGNLDLVRWLVETHGCPISVKTDPKTGMFLSVQTSSSRTLIDLAMTGKPKIEILSYLVRQNLSVLDTNDPTLASKTLHTLMTAGFQFEKKVDEDTGEIESIKIVDSCCDGSMASIEDAVGVYFVFFLTHFAHSKRRTTYANPLLLFFSVYSKYYYYSSV